MKQREALGLMTVTDRDGFDPAAIKRGLNPRDIFIALPDGSITKRRFNVKPDAPEERQKWLELHVNDAFNQWAQSINATGAQMASPATECEYQAENGAIENLLSFLEEDPP